MSETEYKNQFHHIWIKGKHFQKLTPEEEFIYGIMNDHPEYYVHYECGDGMDFNYEKSGEINPFLHISLHIILKKILKSNQFDELNSLYSNLLEKAEEHCAEHILLEELLNELPLIYQQVDFFLKKKNAKLLLPEYVKKKIEKISLKYLQ
ncbi:MAG TPA: DUF1841 family protein [bacterium]|nr:DUF1841 family protein [bacterium]HPN31572.1 DUF1841 family protein [bacterium]